MGIGEWYAPSRSIESPCCHSSSKKIKHIRKHVMSINNNEKMKVKYILSKEYYGFKHNQVYDAVSCKEKLGKKEMISIVNMDGDGEEYAYPASWFEIIDDKA